MTNKYDYLYNIYPESTVDKCLTFLKIAAFKVQPDNYPGYEAFLPDPWVLEATLALTMESSNQIEALMSSPSEYAH